MITPVQMRAAAVWSRPAPAAAPAENPDRVELGASKPWYKRAWEWAFGAGEEAARQVAVQPAGLPAQVAHVARAETRTRVDFAPYEASIPEHVRVARALIKAGSSEAATTAMAHALLAAGEQGESLETAVLAGLDAVPSGYPGNRTAMTLAAVKAVPRLAFTRVAVNGASSEEVQVKLIRTALAEVQSDPPPLALALKLLDAVPDNYPGNRRSIGEALLKALKEDPHAGDAARLAHTLASAASNDNCKTAVSEHVLRARQREEALGPMILGAIAAIPSNYPGNRAEVTRAAVRALEKDAELGGYAQLGGRLVKALSNDSLGTAIGISVIESGLARRSLVETAQSAIDTIPSNYPGNRCAVARAILNELRDYPQVALAQRMVAACSNDECRTAIVMAALAAVSAGGEAPLAATGKALMDAIPGNYPGNRQDAGKALLKEMRAYYSDPDASRIIDDAMQRLKSGGAAAVEAMAELARMKTARQQVEDLAAAVTGQAGVGGVEERGEVVVIGGVRVKVRK